MNRLDIYTRVHILHLLIEGNSLRATARIAGVSRNTVDKLLRDVGRSCLAYQNQTLRNLPCNRVECDEIWSYCYAKDRNVPPKKRGILGYGDVWTWVAICADTKIVPCWHVGRRGLTEAKVFMRDLQSRLANRVQLSTDGLIVYLEAVDSAFEGNVDYGQLGKIYKDNACIGSEPLTISGNPNNKKVSTSYIERQNLTMCMNIKRFARRTNCFSKKLENHMHAISLHYMYYNFARIHQSLRVSPAMEAGVSNHLWEVSEIAELSN